MKKTKGVIICAWDHPYYGNYAATLAASIRFTCPEIPVTLLHHGKATSHYTDVHRSFFEQMIEIPDHCFYSKNVRQPFIAKLYAYTLSPYDYTIQLDADMIMLPNSKKLSHVFEELKDVDFTIQNRSNYDINSTEQPDMWASLSEIKNEYKVEAGRFFYVSSEFIYYKKTKENKKLFQLAVKTFDSLKIQYKRFAGGIPDELPLSIAMLLTGTVPHAEGYRPIYWESAEKKHYTTAKLKNSEYTGYSIGGALPANGRMVEVYNALARYYGAQYGFTPFPYKEKRAFAHLRTNL